MPALSIWPPKQTLPPIERNDLNAMQHHRLLAHTSRAESTDVDTLLIIIGLIIYVFGLVFTGA